MILVDSSVWIDYFNGRVSSATDLLDAYLGVELIATGDIILMEVLRGFRSDADYDTAKRLMSMLPVYDLLGESLAIRAAEHFRYLRKKGVTVRKTADVIIATFCIEHDHPLLFADKDFQPFVTHFGLKPLMTHLH